jgi:hypothetical protein
MKKLFVIITVGLLLLNCKSDAIEKPENLVDEDQMVDILYDLYVINAIKASNVHYLIEHDVTSANYIFNKYKVDSLQFAQSDKYYASHIEDYEKLYQRVTERVQANKAVLDSLILKNPVQKVKKEKKATEAIPFKKRDSLRKSRVIKNTLFKESVKN